MYIDVCVYTVLLLVMFSTLLYLLADSQRMFTVVSIIFVTHGTIRTNHKNSSEFWVLGQ